MGWIEELITRPGSECAKEAERFRESLDGYPILDEHHHSELEMETINDNWPAILGDLQRDLVAEFLQRNAENPGDDDMNEQELQAWLSEIEDQISMVASEYGETREGWINYSKSDISAIADKLVDLREQDWGGDDPMSQIPKDYNEA